MILLRSLSLTNLITPMSRDIMSLSDMVLRFERNCSTLCVGDVL